MLSQARKTVVAAALALTAGASTAQAYSLPSWNGMFSGSFTLLDPDGLFIESDPAVTGLVHWDSPTSTGAAILFPSSTFFGYMWTAHNITLSATAPNVVHADMLWDWGPHTNNHVTMDFSMPVTGYSTYTMTTLDGDGDGIIGNAMDIGPFAGWNATLSGTVTTIPVDLSAFYCFDCWADPEPSGRNLLYQ